MTIRRGFLLASFLVSLFAAGLVWSNEALRWAALPFVAWALAVTPALIWGARE